jgi:hypothetical protein
MIPSQAKFGAGLHRGRIRRSNPSRMQHVAWVKALFGDRTRNASVRKMEREIYDFAMRTSIKTH